MAIWGHNIRSTYPLSLVDLCLAGTVVCFVVSGASESAPAGLRPLIALFPYVTEYLLLRLAFRLDKRNHAEDLLIVLLCLSGIFECIAGLIQLPGFFRSSSRIFAMSGTFANPGPYGGYIAIVLSVAVAATYNLRKKGRIIDKPLCWLYYLTIAVCSIILPSTLSRASWLAFSVAMLVFALQLPEVHYFVRRKRLLTAAIAAGIALLAAGAFFLKKDSAMGRLFLWKMDSLAILSHPILGTGPGTRLGAFSLAQGNYFINHATDSIEMKFAGSPAYVFNDLLGIGMEAGAVAMILSSVAAFIAICRLVKCHSPLSYGLISLLVFSLFSYPLSLDMFKCVTAMLLAAGGSAPNREQSAIEITVLACLSISAIICCITIFGTYQKKKKSSYEYWAYACTLAEKEQIDKAITFYYYAEDGLKDNRAFLYDYGCALQRIGHLEDSNEIFRRGTCFSSDPYYHIRMGENFEELGENDKAEEEYRFAHYMTPGRIYPLLKLMDLYEKEGDVGSAISMGEIALAIPVTSSNGAMVRYHNEASVKMRRLIEMLP